MSESTARVIEARVHGRYLIEQGTGSGLLVGFHGYGENAERHLAELLRIPGMEEWSKVAVQALHPFYNSKTQEVVASWMTKLDREQAIADNIDYVRAVVDAIRPAGNIAFLGFSQGASMAWRAAGAIPCDAVIALGGDIPPDVSAQEDVHLPKVALLARGSRDDFYTTEKLEQDLRFARTVMAAESLEFDGGHEWTDAFRIAVSEFLQRRLA